MALIICPECGQQVSDKAEICPHCGVKIAGNPEIQRRYVSPHPTEKPTQSPTSEGNPPRQPRHTKGKKGCGGYVLLFSLLFALGVCGVGYYFYSDAQRQREESEYENAMSSDNTLVMQMFLQRYADAPQEHKDSVRARMTMMEQELQEWNNALTSGSRKELADYLVRHPDAPQRREIMMKLDSMDYARASRENTVEAYDRYLREHPEGQYAGNAQDFIDEKKSTELQEGDVTLARTTLTRFFQAVNSRNEVKLVETVADVLDNFLTKKDAPYTDVVVFMNKLYKEDVVNLNWHILDDFKVTKEKRDDGSIMLMASFSADLNLDRTDESKESHARYKVEAEVLPEGKIKGLRMRKMPNAAE